MSEDGRLYKIGEVAERVSLSLRTVRYYEEEGLVRPASRTDGGFRLYRESEVARLLVIKQMKPLGFSVSEMRELLDARDTLDSAEVGSRRYEQARSRVVEFIEAANEKIEDLHKKLAAGEDLAVQLRKEIGSRSSTVGNRT